MTTSSKIQIFIIEGFDTSGKSTVVDALSKEFPSLVMKNTYRPLNSDTEGREKIKKIYIQMIAQIWGTESHRYFILDRFYPSEMVYSIKRGYEAMNDPYFESLESWLKVEGEAYLIYCNPGKETIKERLKEHTDSFIKPEDISLLERYDAFYEKCTLNKLKVDTTKPTKEIIEQIKWLMLKTSESSPNQKQLFQETN